MKNLIFILSILFLSSSLFAQIIRTDLIPDSIINRTQTIYSKQIFFDVDDDGNNDFFFGSYRRFVDLSGTHSHYASNTSLRSVDSTRVLGLRDSSDFIPVNWPCIRKPLYSSDTINDSFYWSKYISFENGNEDSAPCNYPPLGDFYIAFKLLKQDGFHFGWFKVNSQQTNFIIFEYGYNTIPNEYIDLAKIKQSTGVETAKAHLYTLSLYPNPNDGSFLIDIPNQLQKEKNIYFTLYDVSGRSIYTEKIATENTKAQENITLPNIAKGIYQATLQDEIIKYSSKLVVQ